jgi:2-methylcitrate dehydratase PrpD
MDCALKIRQKYSPAPKDIAEVVCRTADGPVPRLWEPLADKQKPISSYGAKFSLPYSIAVMLVHGRAGLDEFTDDAIHDTAVLELAGKVRYELDPTIDYPRHFSGHVRVKLKDGSVLEENQPHPRGGFEDPLPPAEIEDKFRANASLALPPENVTALVGVVNKLEQLPSIKILTELLIPGKRGSAGGSA